MNNTNPLIIYSPFIPLDDPMKNYRIKKLTYANGEVNYVPQKKYFWFWKDLVDVSEYCSFRSYREQLVAEEAIKRDYKSNLKPKVEYLDVY